MSPHLPPPPMPNNLPQVLAAILANQAKLRVIDAAQAQLAEIDRQTWPPVTGRRHDNEQDR